LQVQIHGRLERPSLLLSWVAGLVETNMRSMYEKGWGWDGDAKLDELASVKARYIIASLLPFSGTTSSGAVCIYSFDHTSFLVPPTRSMLSCIRWV
jgi:hypothetical protein